ncbi:unnamed protein product [Caenorhabditis nigoni]
MLTPKNSPLFVTVIQQAVIDLLATDKDTSDDEVFPRTSMETRNSRKRKAESLPPVPSEKERRKMLKMKREEREQRERKWRPWKNMMGNKKKRAIKECREREIDTVGKILIRHARRCTLRTHKKRWRRTYKRYVRLEKWRISYLRLQTLYRDATKRIAQGKSCRFRQQWWRMSPKYRRSCFKTAKMLQNAKNVKEVRLYLKGLEKEKRRPRFVIVHEDQTIGQQFLESIHDRYHEDDPEIHKEQSEWTLTERSEFEFEGMADIMQNHFINVVWWPAVLLPGTVFNPLSGSIIRKARNIVTGEVHVLEEEELIPFEWIPKYLPEDTEAVLMSVKQDIRQKYRNAWRFATRFTYHKLDYSTIRIMLGLQQARRFYPHSSRRYTKLHRKRAQKREARKEKAMERVPKRRMVLRKQAIRECRDRKKDSFGKIVMRHSRRFAMRTHEKRWRRRYKRFIRLKKHRIRKIRLYSMFLPGLRQKIGTEQKLSI